MLKCVRKVDWSWINYGAKTRQYLFFIGYAYEFEYDCSKDTKYAQKAIEEYNNLINYEYAFLHANIERLQSAVNSVNP